MWHHLILVLVLNQELRYLYYIKALDIIYYLLDIN